MDAVEMDRRILFAVRAHWRLFERGPTHGELGRALNIGRSRAQRAVIRLVGAGLLTRVPGRHYDLRLTLEGAKKRFRRNAAS